MDPQTLLAVLSIVVIDLTISGDNALVIGMAAHRLDPKQRRLAILFGAGGAIVLRVSFTAAAALLLRVPLLQACGGVLLLWIAFKLLRQGQGESAEAHQQGRNLFDAIRIIIIADAVMSLDNILAVAGASHGDISLLLFGLCLSMPIVMAGSNLVAGLIGRYGWLLPLGSGVLAWTAGGMILEDQLLHRYLPDHAALEYGLPLLLVALVLGSHLVSGRLESLKRSSSVAGGSLFRP
ncbi:MAG: TerC family protein [Chloroflexota bacterium]